MKQYKAEVWRYHIRDFRYFDSWKKAAEFISEDTDEHFITEIEDSKTKKKVENNFFIIGDIWHKATKYRTFEDFYNAAQKAYKKDEEEKKRKIEEFEKMKPIDLTVEKARATLCDSNWCLHINSISDFAELEFSFRLPFHTETVGDKVFAIPLYDFSNADKIIINGKEYCLLIISMNYDYRYGPIMTVKIKDKKSEVLELFNFLHSISEIEIGLKGGEE